MLRLERLLFTGALFARLTNLFPLAATYVPCVSGRNIALFSLFLFLGNRAEKFKISRIEAGENESIL